MLYNWEFGKKKRGEGRTTRSRLLNTRYDLPGRASNAFTSLKGTCSSQEWHFRILIRRVIKFRHPGLDHSLEPTGILVGTRDNHHSSYDTWPSLRKLEDIRSGELNAGPPNFKRWCAPALRVHKFPVILVTAILQIFVTSGFPAALTRLRISIPPALTISFRIALPPTSPRKLVAKASSICTCGFGISADVRSADSSESTTPASTNALRVPPPHSAQLSLWMAKANDARGSTSSLGRTCGNRASALAHPASSKALAISDPFGLWRQPTARALHWRTCGCADVDKWWTTNDTQPALARALERDIVRDTRATRYSAAHLSSGAALASAVIWRRCSTDLLTMSCADKVSARSSVYTRRPRHQAERREDRKSPLSPLRSSIPATSCLTRPAATSALLQIRSIHQIVNAKMLTEYVVLSIAIKVAVVFVRWMVFAVIGSHLTVCWMSEKWIHGQTKHRTYASTPKVFRTISSPTSLIARALSNNITVGTIPCVTNFCASLLDCKHRIWVLWR